MLCMQKGKRLSGLRMRASLSIISAAVLRVYWYNSGFRLTQFIQSDKSSDVHDVKNRNRMGNC